MKKYSRHYLRRCLSVLLAVVMVCAAAQTLVFAVDLGENDITPGWQQGTARARYTTSGTLEITFPESTKSEAAYYAEFYDLDGNDRETPVVETFQLNTARTYADDTTQIGATLDRSWVESSGLDMSHRISVAITAVSSDGWRSEAIEALVGESLDVPDADAQPDSKDVYAPMARFEEGDLGSRDNADDLAYEQGNNWYWIYNNGNGTNAMDINGVYPSDSNQTYKYPGFDSSTAFRLYLNGNDMSNGKISADATESFDVMYRQDNSNFSGAEELWIWVDTSYVEFEEFALQVRYMDRTGPVYIDAVDQRYRDADDFAKIYGEDVYSTVGYAARNMGESVPIYYQNEDGLWDTIYTNSEGYLNNFGHYRGFLRVPIEYLQNEDVNSQYQTLVDERPYSYEIRVWNNYVFDHGVRATISAAEAYDENFSTSWTYRNAWNQEYTVEFNRELVENNLKNGIGVGFSVVPIEDIASVGITWSGASADSANKSFYIDQIGFSGDSLPNASNLRDTPLAAGLTASAADSVNGMIEKYLPETVTVADAGIIEDLETICDRLNVTRPEALQKARQSLDAQLQGTVDVVDYVHQQMQNGSADIAILYEIYQSFTLGEIHRLGLKDEAELISRYNNASLSEWYPGALGELYYQAFNNFEQNYEIGQTAFNEYDDYIAGTDYFRSAHSVNWQAHGGGLEGHKNALENRDNFVAYAWANYDNNSNGYGQRFGYGYSSIAQNGFDNSKAVNTDIYRDPLVDSTENYRISVTYQGEEAADYTQLNGHTFAGADSFVFYGDFTNMTNIRKAWVTVRIADGRVYSHDDGAQQLSYQFFDLDNPGVGWQTLMSQDSDDGCMSAELIGKRGFFRISLDTFGEIQNNNERLDPSATVKQVKFFLSGNLGNNKRLDDSFAVDMFGFAADTAATGFTQLKELSTPVKEPEYDATNVDAVKQLTDGLFTLVDNQQLFNYVPADYQKMLKAYQTLTVEEKEKVDEYILNTYKFTVDKLQLFVKNYDDWSRQGAGNLQVNATTADTLRGRVTDAFNANTALIDGTPGEIDSIFDTYQSYPDYYKYSVQTYWPDRNLHAVFPNYNPEDVVTNKVTMTLNGSDYIGTLDLSYVGAVTDTNGMKFTLSESTVDLTSADGGSIQVTPSYTTTVANGSTVNQIVFKISEDKVTHAGTYSGKVTLSVDLPADGGADVEEPEKYRKSIEITVTLKCEPSYTVIIPADISLPWNTTEYDASVSVQEGFYLPDSASIKVTTSTEDRVLKATASEFDGSEIPYKLSGEGTNWTFTNKSETLSADLSIGIDSQIWQQVPLTRYEDVITFNVEYSDSISGS